MNLGESRHTFDDRDEKPGGSGILAFLGFCVGLVLRSTIHCGGGGGGGAVIMREATWM